MHQTVGTIVGNILGDDEAIYKRCREINVNHGTIYDIINDRRKITFKSALILEKLTNFKAEVFCMLQMEHSLAELRNEK